MVPMLFAPHADDLTARVAALAPHDVLEVGAGTAVVTQRLADTVSTAAITATDLSPVMVADAQERGTSRPVTWRDADIMALPFVDEQFHAVLCQFGVMFAPDAVEVELLELRCRAPDNDHPAIALCQGGPIRDVIEARHPGRLDDATAAAAAAIARDHGTTDLDARMGALVVTATKR